VQGDAAVAFDAYGTLFDVLSVTALCERLFPAQGPALAHTWRAKQLQYTWQRTLMRRYEGFQRVTEDALAFATRSLGLELTPGSRQQLMNAYSHLTPFPDVVPGLATLKQRGLRLAILSNGERGMLESSAAYSGIAPFFDAILSANEVEAYKPSPAVYELATKRLGVATSTIAFVSANSWDIAGAGSAGLPTFWIRRNEGDPAEELGFPAHHIVGSVTELSELILA
jgi:2-haloacid dehalogenase